MSIAVVVKQHCQKHHAHFKHLCDIDKTFRCTILAFSVDYEKAGIDWPYKKELNNGLQSVCTKGALRKRLFNDAERFG